MELTQKYVQYLFDYNELSGILKWKNKTSPKSRNKIGKEAGCIDSHGYRVVTIHNKFYNLLLLKLIYDKLCEFGINCNTLNKDNDESK